MINKNIKWLLIASLTLVACNKDEETSSADAPATSGAANFSKYVALGDSYAAGYSDGALFKAGQQTAYPAILAGQFAEAGGGAFTTPFTNDNFGGLLLAGNPIPGQGKRLYYTGNASNPVAPVPGTISTDVANHLSGSFNNLGVPGAKSFHLVAAGYGNTAGIMAGLANPYYARFSSSPTSKIVDDATNQAPTFFSLWIGGNDVLSYALSGGTGVNQTGNLNPATYGSNDITDPNVYANVFNTLVTQLTTGGRGGVVANLPYVNSLPFFTTIPTNPIPGLSPANVTSLNQLFGGINAALSGAGLPTRYSTLVADDGNPATIEANPLLIVDESLLDISVQITAALTPVYGATTATFLGNLYGKTRHAKNVSASNRDFILLTSKGVIGTTSTSAPAPFNVVGVSYPMQDGTTLTIAEAAEIKTATDAYNTTIQSVATSKGLAFVDLKTAMSQLSSVGVSEDGYTLLSDFVTGGAFSLDGIHPSPRGYAYIANRFIDAINAKYGSTLKKVNIGTYRVLFPAVLN
ncbi:MAG: hypothetical protein QM535_08230 [Limnohabitans sp.]|nr:hypothetical protein [Limnohabitans sp.]